MSDAFIANEGAAGDACLSATQGLCNVCGRRCEAKLVARGERVVIVKWCPDHGLTEGLVSSNRGWTARAAGYLKPGTEPRQRSVAEYHGCPESCGLCPEHQQHTCVPLFEITPACDMHCPICLVSGRVKPALTLPDAERILDRLVACEGRLNMLTLTGGEPTQHPQLLAIVDRCLRPEIGIVSLSTNGLWIERDEGLLRALCERGVVISLQLDGFDDQASLRLRGQAGLAACKRRAVERVLVAGGRLSLTFTLAKDNAHELPAVLQLLFQEERVLSVMVQPLAAMGPRPPSDLDRLTVPDAVKLLADASGGVLAESDFSPLPCSHPTCFALTYLLKLGNGQLVSLPSILDAEAYLNLIKNQALVGTDRENLQDLRDALYRLWSSDGLLPQRESLLATLRKLILDLGRPGGPLGHREVLDLGTRNIKSVFIHHFMDRTNFDFARVVKCCNHYPQIDGRLLPACVRNNLM